MNIAQIENNLQLLTKAIDTQTFIYDLLLAYGTPKSIIARLQKGTMNLAKTEGEILWKKTLFFKPVLDKNLHEAFEEILQQDGITKHSPRFIVVTNYQTLLAIDTKTKDRLDTPITDLARQYDFFLPLAGMEKAQHQTENPADVKAAERMAKLYDEIKKDNPTNTPEEVHHLNVFLSRLLFCFFAEDTGIFPNPNMFTHAIATYTQADGSDLQHYLETLFGVLNTEKRNPQLADHYNKFPYVNGGLFAVEIQLPIFTRKSRQAIIDSGGEDWSAINPDIFGSMIQAVISPEHRGSLGMHYTSVPNIMKVIKPLFLDELYDEFEKAKPDVTKLKKLLLRIGNIKIFDPACGSGNFLIIAYKELRRLELQILMALKNPQSQLTGFEDKQTALFGKVQPNLMAVQPQQSSYQINLFSEISLQNFYGIELDDFAHEIAILSLWLAQHQMNIEFKVETGIALPSLPLKAGGHIVAGNATRLDWEAVCPKKDGDEIYILGNPPYLGARILNDIQKTDMKLAFEGKVAGFNDLDYIAAWFFKGGNYLQNTNAKFAFVSTNSICQGSQVASLWPFILNDNLEIDFVHQSFKWANNAKAKAAVIVIILGLRKISNKPKYIFNKGMKSLVRKISPYLIEGENIYVSARRNQLSNIPSMNFGSMPNDGGHLTLNFEEYKSFIVQHPNAQTFVKKLIGSKEFINDIQRWCLWIDDDNEDEAIQIDFIRDRVEQVKKHRLASDREATNILARTSYKFSECRYKPTDSIIVPRVSSERRDYMPIDFLNSDFVISDSAQAVYDAESWVFAMITSRMHMTWLRAVAGRLKSDYRYSTALCYNTFPFPPITDAQKQELEKHVYRIIEEREHHSEKTLAQLYDPEKMPAGLRQAHHQNDLAVDRCYRPKPFSSDEERLEYLFKLYEQMIAEEKEKGTLFEAAVKAKKTKARRPATNL